MKIHINLNHPEDKLDGWTIAHAFRDYVENYIRDKGHLSNYNPNEWEISIGVEDEDTQPQSGSCGCSPTRFMTDSIGLECYACGMTVRGDARPYMSIPTGLGE